MQATYPPGLIKHAIGERFAARESPRILKEKPRCWRLSYANEFHLDITPSIPNPACVNGGELVPDKAVKEWKASNPKAYRALFDRRAALVPRIRAHAMPEFGATNKRADIEPYPAPTAFKGFLRRTVQIGKRHRDMHFANDRAGLAPISVIITTLASRSYEYCVTHFVYDTEFDLLLDVLHRLPDFIEHRRRPPDRCGSFGTRPRSARILPEKWNRKPDTPPGRFLRGMHASCPTSRNWPAPSASTCWPEPQPGLWLFTDREGHGRDDGQVTDNRRDSTGSGFQDRPLHRDGRRFSTPVRGDPFFGADCV